MTNFGFQWHGFLGNRTGYGEEARQFILALADAGVPIQAVPIKTKDLELALLEEVELATGGGDGATIPDFCVAVRHCYPSIAKDIKEPTSFFNVVRCGFETDRVPEHWISDCLAMDEVWVTSDFNLRAFQNAKFPQEKLFKLPTPINTNLYKPEGPRAQFAQDKRFKFLSVFEWLPRKGWDVLLEAYWKTFSPEEPVVLFIKTWSSAGKNYKKEVEDKAAVLGIKKRPEIIFLEELSSSQEMASIYRASDCFVLPSHGESYGIPYMEAMATGTPVIGTGWGGNLEFMNKENSFLLDYELATVPTEAREESITPGYQWANPDLEQLKSMFRYVFENHQKAKEVGLRGRVFLEEHFSHEKIARVLKDKLNSLLEY